jgi:hypothetical protein
MDRAEVLKQFTEVLDDFIRQQAYGDINIKIRGGVPMLLCTTINRDLQSKPTGVPHGHRPENRTR